MEETNVDQPVEKAVAATASAATVEGTVKSFDFGKGYGFISHDGSSKEVFVHQEAILGEGSPRISTGDRVSFELTQGPKGPRAASVRKL